MKKVGLLILLIGSIINTVSAQCVSGNCINGKGEYRFSEGGVYKGSFKNKRFHGYGEMKYSNGDVYQGQWKNHKRSGNGKLNVRNGDVYIGNFLDDMYWGKGSYTYKDGDQYKGEWVKHLAHGKGKYTFSDNEYYEGEFFQGKMSGVGSFHYKDGTVYIGNWQKNKKHGEGKMHYTNGEKVHGIWDMDELVERVNNTIENTVSNTAVVQNEIEEEEFSQTVWKDCGSIYCHNEIGTLTYRDGSRWEGEFLNGKPHGVGTMYYSGGNRYEGEVQNHAPNGEGVMYFENGQVVGATWNDGYPIKRKQKNEIIVENNKKIEVESSAEVKIWAVIVGISAYSHMPALRYTDDDAYQIFAFLKSPEGGALPNNQIKLLIDENATRQNIIAGMNEVLLKADENDVVLMYYSGHGLPGMFLPIDFDGYRNNLDHKEVLDIFNKSKAKHKLCIADACHSGSLIASRSPFRQQLDVFYDEYNNTKGGTALIMSSKSEEVSLETSGLRQGIFSHYLIRGLEGEADDNGNKIVTVSELFEFISTGVMQYSQNKQQPTIAGNYDEDMPVSTVR